MKKNLLFLIVLFSAKAFSQCVPDNTITSPGIYPDSLPHAIVGAAYSATVQIRVPLDTTVLYNGTPVPATIDSVIITKVTGLPTSPAYNYSCTPASCVFKGGTNGCVFFYGPAPVPSMVGNVYPIEVYTTTYEHPTALPGFTITQLDTIRKYHIVVDNSSAVSTIGSQRFNVTQNHPNPADGLTTIELYSLSNTVMNLKVANILGTVVYSKGVALLPGTNKIIIDAKDFADGIYFYTIGGVTHRMIVDHK